MELEKKRDYLYGVVILIINHMKLFLIILKEEQDVSLVMMKEEESGLMKLLKNI